MKRLLIWTVACTNGLNSNKEVAVGHGDYLLSLDRSLKKGAEQMSSEAVTGERRQSAGSASK